MMPASFKRYFIFMVNKLISVVLFTSLLALSGCSSWVYRIDIPQGNFLDKRGIEKLQLGMTKEQVKFVLGTPVIADAFEDDMWNYIYILNSGKSKKLDKEKRFIVTFVDGLLTEASGDFELPESFHTPIKN